MAALETMADGIPVIALNIGGLPEVIEHEKTGFLIQPGDGAPLAEYMELLIEDGDLRKKLGIEARKTAIEKFHPNKIVPEYEKLYRMILKH